MEVDSCFSKGKGNPAKWHTSWELKGVGGCKPSAAALAAAVEARSREVNPRGGGRRRGGVGATVGAGGAWALGTCCLVVLKEEEDATI